MKIGDQIPVSVEGLNVTMAIIEEIDGDKATIYIPATRAVFGIRSNLVAPTPEVEHAFIGEADKEPLQTKDDIGDGMGNLKLDSNAID